MFEGIHHSYSVDGQTGARYRSNDVHGFISFHVEPQRSCVLSSIGPAAAVRECSASHSYRSFSRRYKARTAEEVTDQS